MTYGRISLTFNVDIMSLTNHSSLKITSDVKKKYYNLIPDDSLTTVEL